MKLFRYFTEQEKFLVVPLSKKNFLWFPWILYLMKEKYLWTYESPAKRILQTSL